MKMQKWCVSVGAEADITELREATKSVKFSLKIWIVEPGASV
jgi:hypothetical protein